MPKYIVQAMHIMHGKKGEKTAQTYGPGETMDLAEAEAATLVAKGYLTPAPAPEKGEKKPEGGKSPAPDA